MFFCNEEVSLILSVIKIIYNISSVAILISFIFVVMMHLIHGMIGKDREKIWQIIFNKLFSLIILFLLPVIIFLLFEMIIPKEIMDIDLVWKCFKIAN